MENLGKIPLSNSYILWKTLEKHPFTFSPIENFGKKHLFILSLMENLGKNIFYILTYGNLGKTSFYVY